MKDISSTGKNCFYFAIGKVVMEGLFAALLLYVNTTVPVVWPAKVIVSQLGVKVSQSTSSWKNALLPVRPDREALMV